MTDTHPKPTVRIRDNGPLVITAGVTLLDAEGNAFTTEGNLFLCRCGLSPTKPFCDGTHKRQGFASAPRAEAGGSPA